MYALVARGNSSLMVQGCDFQMICSKTCNHVQLQDGVSRAVVTGNMVQGPFKVDNKATIDPRRIQIEQNVHN